MPTALITGITGQDGGYLAELLSNQGWSVQGVLRPGEIPPQHLRALEGTVSLREADVLDAAALAHVFRDTEPDAVYNLVGVSSVAQSWEEPALTFRVNGEVAARLLDLAWASSAAGKACRFLQASSAEIFAGSGVVPQDELTPISPRSPYGASKAFAHHLVQVYRARGLHSVNAVLYNHESPRRPPTFVTRKITQAVAAIADGSDQPLVLGNLNARRDWGWAPEYVRGMSLALHHSRPDDWVFATGRSHSVEDFARMAFAHVGIENWRQYVRLNEALARPTDAPELVGDASKAATVLGWRAEVALAGLVGRMVDADRVD